MVVNKFPSIRLGNLISIPKLERLGESKTIFILFTKSSNLRERALFRVVTSIYGTLSVSRRFSISLLLSMSIFIILDLFIISRESECVGEAP